VNADFRFVAPDLLLSRDSILSVFSASTRKFIGGGLTYELGHGVDVGANYHLVLEPGEQDVTPSGIEVKSTTYYGQEADAKVDWARGDTRLGAEAFYLRALENGYWGGRIFGRQDFGRFFATADVMAHRFREEINGEHASVTGTLTAGMDLAKGFSAVISGRAGMTPYLEQTYDLMVKLAYNASYRIREVR
jgi:hypothetical protein